ncbi:putative multiple sugar transport system permease protein [Sediminihabitans luteus]|uniref:Xylose transport system permease protein XylH n=1 Tax=Sediminihabitans luteus TaxID=1138585 RepID=A0A2M9CYW5_9CELL|nr:multiple monosaccharide ABC transporter permease [Sediminihabitans luteus]PJJ77131.1 putative multiple sugar transport system permease protein [Sediminihabitans luteus]GII98579.1 ABC transporter permease [Sediminihabitans luteus]
MNAVREYVGRNMRQYGIVAALLVIVLLFQVLTGGKLLFPNNIASLIQQNAYVMILAIGMVMVIVAGHIDLSVGSVVAFVGGLCAIMMTQWGLPWFVAVVLSLVVGALVGCWQGFWIAYVGIPAFIVTLAGMLIFRGLAIVLVGTTVAGLPGGFNKISNGSVPNWLGFVGDVDVVTVCIGAIAAIAFVWSQWRSRRSLAKHELTVEPMAAFVAKNVVAVALIGIVTYWLSLSAGGTPIVLLIVGVLVIGYSFVLNRTVFGRHVYAVGGNRHAAVLSGVNSRRVDFGIFVNMGVLAAVAAIVTTSRAGAGVAAAGMNYELDAIAACFIGGTAVTGGVGRISGAMIGALIMGVLNMGLSIMAVDAAWQQAIKGLVLLLAVAFDILSKRRSRLA